MGKMVSSETTTPWQVKGVVDKNIDIESNFCGHIRTQQGHKLRNEAKYSFIFEKLIDSKIVFFKTEDLVNQLKIDFESNLNWLDAFDRKKSIDFFNRNLMESNFDYYSALFNLSK